MILRAFVIGAVVSFSARAQIEVTRTDAYVAPAAVLLWGGTLLIPGADHCRLCDSHLNGVDSTFHDALTGFVFSRSAADTTSTVIAGGVVPVFALASAYFATGPQAKEGAWWRTSVIVIESLAVSGFVTQSLKLGFARQRPDARYGTGVVDSSSAESFPSGHTSSVAAVVISSALCADLQESRAAPALWISGGTLIAVTGTLRMIAEKHWFTDVLGGAAIGIASGFAVPLLHRSGATVTPNGFEVHF
jgi:membrane-associated phospholipid phosphatase